MTGSRPIPVILDTDIGTDIDDTWALTFLLKCPELDLKLVLSATGDTRYRARLLARLLERAGRTDVPVGVGLFEEDDPDHRQEAWIAGYELSSYPGEVREDGVRALVETIEQSEEPVTLIAIGPLPNIHAALKAAPWIAQKTRFVGMHGSIRMGIEGHQGAVPEYNVAHDVASCRAAFDAPWHDMTITPLDTCGRVRLRGAEYRAVAESKDPLARAVIENYRVWLDGKPDTESSILFDTVAVHLAFSTKFLKMEDMGIRVSDDGYTVPDDARRSVHTAVEWKDQDGFQEFLVQRLIGKG